MKHLGLCLVCVAVLGSAAACGDSGETGAGGSGTGGSGTTATGTGTGTSTATGTGSTASSTSSSTATGSGGAGGAGGDGSGGSFAGGCADLVGSCLASNGACSDHGVGGPGQTQCEANTFVWSTQGCADRSDAMVGGGCLSGPPCTLLWQPTSFSANYATFQANCEAATGTWIEL